MHPLVYFARHGQTSWNAEARFQGQVDTPLNDIGRAQAIANGRALKAVLGRAEGFDFVASPLGRTRATMEAIRREMGLDPFAYRTDRTLVEVHFGDWQGSTVIELEARQPGCTRPREHDKWMFRPPGDAAESYAVLAERIRPWFEALARPTVCVTHGGVIRALFTLTGQMEGPEAAAMDVPQDRLLRLRDGRLDWL
jgi:broad specificity phosphatase PhoE